MDFTDDQEAYLLRLRQKFEGQAFVPLQLPLLFPSEALEKGLLQSLSANFLMLLLLQDMLNDSRCDDMLLWSSFIAEEVDLFFLYKGLELLLVKLLDARDNIEAFQGYVSLLQTVLQTGRILNTSQTSSNSFIFTLFCVQRGRSGRIFGLGRHSPSPVALLPPLQRDPRSA